MDADKQLKRTSPLHVSDAYTVVDNIENIDDNSNQNGNYFKYIFLIKEFVADLFQGEDY